MKKKKPKAKKKLDSVLAWCWKDKDLGILRPPTIEEEPELVWEKASDLYNADETDGEVVRVRVMEVRGK